MIVWDEIGVRRYLENGSFHGTCALYAAYLSNKTKKGFTFENIAGKATLFNKAYMQGYFISASSADLFTNSYNSTGSIYNVTTMNPILFGIIKDVIYKRAQKHDSAQKITENDEYSWMKLVKQVESAFS